MMPIGSKSSKAKTSETACLRRKYIPQLVHLKQAGGLCQSTDDVTPGT